MKIKIVKLLNLIRFRIIGTIFLSIIITGNAVKATAPNVDYRFIIPILVMGGVLLIPLIRGHRIVRRIYRRGVHHYNSRLVVCILFILLKNVYDKRESITRGVRITWEAPLMRHFTVQLERL